MSSKITIRKATWSDLQAITNIAIAVYPQIPADRYEFPYADKYPRDFEKFKFEETKTFLNNDLYPRKDLHSMVAEIEDDAGEKIIIAHAMWDLLALKDKSKVPAMNKLTISKCNKLSAILKMFTRVSSSYHPGKTMCHASRCELEANRVLH